MLYSLQRRCISPYANSPLLLVSTFYHSLHLSHPKADAWPLLASPSVPTLTILAHVPMRACPPQLVMLRSDILPPRPTRSISSLLLYTTTKRQCPMPS